MISGLKSWFFSRLAKRIQEQNFIQNTCEVHSSVYISGSRLEGEVNVNEACKIYQAHIDGKITIGRYTSIWGPNIKITSILEKSTIGSFCSIARNVSIQSYNHNINLPSSYHFETNIYGLKRQNELSAKGPIIVGNDVWIGAGAVILSGVKIGHGAVIGANALITKDVPPYAIVAGNPGKIIKYRFSESKINELLEMAWWDWSIEKIKKNKKFFLNPIN